MILLKNCLSLYCDIPVTGMDLLITGNQITAIKPDIVVTEKQEPLEIIDCSSSVVVPGFVNTHHHFYQTLTRNLPAVQNAKLFTWLTYLYEIWKNIDPEAVYWSTQLATAELLKTGCTCTTDHHYLYPKGFSEDLMGLQFEAARETGIRFAPTRGSMSLSKKDGGLPPDSVVQEEETILLDSERVINRYHDSSDFSLQRIALAPCSPFSVSERLLKETVLLARRRGVKLHTHLAETADEDQYCLRKYGKRPLVLMQEAGFIGSDVSYAHGIHFTDEELDLLQKTGTGVCHCPSSNMRLGSGIARVKEMITRGIPVSLAVDGSASNDSSDYLGEMRQALFLQRIRYGASAMDVSTIFNMATVEGAKTLGFSKTGRLREGYAADLAIFDLNSLEYAGSLSDPVAALLFCGISHKTAYTIVNGRIVVREGHLTTASERKIMEKANDCSRRLNQKI